MKLKTLRLINFRNYSDETISFSPHINCLYGENAQGKTNILEAIHLLCNGRSFRTNQLKDLIQNEKDFFRLEAKIEKNGITHTLTQTYDLKQRTYKLNEASIQSFSKLLNHFPAIIHTPKDTDLITGAPTLRRKLIDFQISQSDIHYLFHLTRYYRALKQRNALLKKKTPSAIALFENEMAKASSYIIEKRNEYLKTLIPVLENIQKRLSLPFENYQIQYDTFSKNFQNIQSEYLALLEKMRPQDEKYQATQIGIHKDDYEFFINKQLAKNFASEGQKKSFIASLKLGLWEALSSQIDTPIIMMIDDFNAHLDSKRLSSYFNSLNDLGQVFITQPLPLKSSLDKIQLFHVQKGSIKSF
ncbi:MAG TPA: DNA replication/repair protein RecF [Chlamydiales bacterium]|nr:DNA replication/repair protein RecF [Chlamydiales bacterium]